MALTEATRPPCTRGAPRYHAAGIAWATWTQVAIVLGSGVVEALAFARDRGWFGTVCASFRLCTFYDV